MFLIGVFGHSLGGMAAINATGEDLSIKACITLDGWGNKFMKLKALEKPCLCLFGNHHPELTEEERKKYKISLEEQEKYKKERKENEESLATFCKNSGPNCYHIIIKNAAHMDFSDFILTKKQAAKFLHVNQGPVEPYATIVVMNDYIRTFFDLYLQDKKVTPEEFCNLHPEAVIIEQCGQHNESG